MLKNQIITTFRSLKRNGTFSLINIVGLSLSMVACLLIMKYVEFGRSYDQFHEDKDNIYRVYRIAKGESPDDGVASVFPGMTPVMKNEIPEFEKVARLIGSGKIFQSFAFTNYQQDKPITFNIDHPYFVDDDLLDIFTFNWIEGDNSASLSAPNQVVISSSIAKKFFGDESAIGKSLHFKNMEIDYQVTGVFEDWPDNSHVQFDVLCSFSSLPKEWELDSNFGWGNFYTYARVNGQSDLNLLETKLNDAVIDKEPWYKEEGITFKMQKVSDIYLTSHHAFELKTNGNADTLVFLTIIGIFIMIIAWVNYINLSTSKLIDRAKEVGIRKVLGSQKRQLIKQFLFESIVINVLALLISLTVIQITSPFFEELLGLSLDLFGTESFLNTLGVLAAVTIGAILFSLYPATLFANQKISSVIKGKSKVDKRGLLLRKSLTTFQYIVAAVLLFGTVSISRQLSFMQEQSLGMDIEQTLIVKKPYSIAEEREVAKDYFINEVNKLSSVEAVSVSSEIPGKVISRRRWVALGPGENDKSLYARDIAVDTAFMSLYDIKVLYGQAFTKGMNIERSLMLSKSAAEDLFETDIESWIGKTIYYETEPYQLVAIVDDISQESLKNDPQPHIYTPHNRVRFFSIKLKTDELSNTLASIGGVFNDSYKSSHFDYFFLDSYFNRQYQSDRLFSRIFRFFSVLAIVVTMLGLFGLSLYNISRRSKEISIRKVLGAEVFQLFQFLTKEYFVLLLVSILIAMPIGSFFLNEWLSGFSSQMPIGMVLYVLPVSILVLLTLTTVCYQVLKVARANPVNSLRNE